MRPQSPSFLWLSLFAFAAVLFLLHGAAVSPGLAAGLELSPQERNWIAEHPRLRVGVDPAWPPFDYVGEQGTHQGMASDYLRIVASRLGIAMEVVPDLRWSEVMQGAQEGRIDLVACLTRTPARSKFLHFTESYLNFPIVIIMPDNAPLVGGLQDLAGKKVAVVKGYAIEDFIREKFPQTALVLKTSPEEGLQDVAMGRVQAYVDNLAVTSYLIRKLHLSNLKVAAPATQWSDELRMGVRSDLPELVGLIDKALGSITAEEHEQVRSKWVSPRYEYGINPERVRLWLMGTVAVAAAVLGLLFMRNRTLTRWNQRLSSEVELRRRAEENLRLAKIEAERANDAKSEFLANMSHEIRTPLNAILGLTHLTLQTSLTARQRDYLEKVSFSGRSLLHIINDILDFSKIEAGKLDLEHMTFCLDDLLAEVAALTSAPAQKKGIEVLLRPVRNCPQDLVGDPLRLGQVLVNLMENAVKFTERGEIVLSVDLLEQIREPDRVGLRFSVRDTGIGIAPEVRDRLFDSFTQGDNTTTRRFGGSGLGLAICRRLVELMGGTIGVDSDPGRGCTFFFTAVFARGQLPRLRPGRSVPDPDLRGLRVLLMDDNALSLQILGEFLASFGFEVQSAASVQEFSALMALSGDKPRFDLLILDWGLAEHNAMACALRLHAPENASRVPVLLMVDSYRVEEGERVAMELGFEGTVVKPVCPSGLFDAIMLVFGRLSPVSKRSAGGPWAWTVSGGGEVPRVLLVEDNTINRQVARELLEGAGLQVDEAQDGVEALELVCRQRFALVLMDIQMPRMDGLECTRRIREKGRREGDARYLNLPIIAMTAHALVGDRERSLAAGMNDHVTKPIEPQMFFETLAQWIGCPLTPVEYPTPAGSGALPPHIDGLDQVSGLRCVAGNRDLYISLLNDFAEDYSQAAGQIREALEAGRMEDAKRLAHTIKGLAGNLGALEVQQSALVLERAIHEGRIDTDSRVEELGEVLARVCNAIRASGLTPSSSGMKQSEGQGSCSWEDLKEKLYELCSLLQMNDTAAVPLFEDLRGDISRFRPDAVRQVAKALEMFDFRTALRTLEMLGKQQQGQD